MLNKAAEFGKYLRKLRGKTTQIVLAQAMNKSVMYVSNIENGKNMPPNVELLHMIATALNLDEEQRLDLIDEAAKARGTVASDILDILSKNKKLRQMIREYKFEEK